MNMNFKPLTLAAAVAAASVGYAGVAAAQVVTPIGPPVVANNGLGDLALVPYYSVKDGYGTGVHVINTSKDTQVVKLRFRRGSDSLDAMDFNLIMSAEDEWVGFLQDVNGVIQLTTQDTTCTAPLFNGTFLMPNIYRDGADEGYIEVISMGATDETVPGTLSAVATNAKHVKTADGTYVPVNCQFVEDNFLDTVIGALVNDTRGVVNSFTTHGAVQRDPTGVAAPVLEDTAYIDGGNVLKVSWFIRNTVAGLEFGDDAVIIQDFETLNAMMTHQEQGIFSGNLRGFDFPDLNGSAPDITTQLGVKSIPSIGKFNQLRAGTVLGVKSIINDWSNNTGLDVGTDWIITFPGQYTMLDMPRYLGTLGNLGGLEDGPGGVIGGGDSTCTFSTACDNRDLPVIANFSIYDREENLALSPDEERDVVISPSIPGLPPTATQLKYEVNVVHFSDREVMDSQYDDTDVSAVRDLLLPAVSGWARLDVRSDPLKAPAVCDWPTASYGIEAARAATMDPNTPVQTCTAVTEPGIPMVGFVAWERSFAGNENANYGRAVAHSFESSSL
jgi:hypothetical protein